MRRQLEELEQELHKLAGDDFRKTEGLSCLHGGEMSLAMAKELLSATRNSGAEQTSDVPSDVHGYVVSPVSSLASQIPAPRSAPCSNAADRRAKLQRAARILLRASSAAGRSS